MVECKCQCWLCYTDRQRWSQDVLLKTEWIPDLHVLTDRSCGCGVVLVQDKARHWALCLLGREIACMLEALNSKLCSHNYSAEEASQCILGWILESCVCSAAGTISQFSDFQTVINVPWFHAVSQMWALLLFISHRYGNICEKLAFWW